MSSNVGNVSDVRRTLRSRSSRSSAGMNSGSSRSGPARPVRSTSSLFFFVLVSATIVVIGSTGPFAGVRAVLSDALSPVRSAGSTLVSPLSNLFDSVGSQQDLIDENLRLREENIDLKSRVALADDAIRQRRELLAMEKLTDITSLPSVVAEVVGGTTSNFDVTVQIDAGSSDGIRPGMPVVAGYGLVGRVTVVTRNSARVRLFTDGSMGVGVRLANSGEVGIIKGAGSGKEMRVNGIDPNTVVVPGELVTTSGLGDSRYPNGLALGRVVRATAASGQLEQEVVMMPFSDLDRVGLVRVLLWVPPDLVPSVPSTTRPPATTLPTGVSITLASGSAPAAVGSGG